jgi:hypothetical protein
MGPATTDWVYLAITCDGNLTDLYYNGMQVGETWGVKNQFDAIRVAVNRSNTRYFQGTIDDVRIYNRVLSKREILNSYAQIEGNIDMDPLFVNPTNGDFTLLPNSPCIDAADNTAVPADIADVDSDGDTDEPLPWDISGNPRFIDQPEVPDTGNGTVPIVDMGAFEANYVLSKLKLTPQALNCRSQGDWVKAHFTLPGGFTIADIDPNRLAILYPLGIESAFVEVFINEEGLVEVAAAFDREAVCSLAGDWPEELTVFGFLKDGSIFYGRSTVRIIAPGPKEVAELASSWLQGDCDYPDWCDGMDMNKDSIVNFLDYPLLMNSQVEFVNQIFLKG